MIERKLYYYLCLIPLVVASCSTTEKLSVEATPEIHRAVKLTPKDRASLLKNAAAWEVPQPASRAGLVKLWIYSSGTEKNLKDFYTLGFTHTNDPRHALVGFEKRNSIENPNWIAVPDATELSLDDIMPTSPFARANSVNFGLITGIQLIRRGDEQLGVALIEKSLGEESLPHHSVFTSPSSEEPVVILARSCLAARLNEMTSTITDFERFKGLISPEPDFPSIRQQIQKLLDDQPVLKSKTTDRIMEGLAANVAHKASPPGSIEQIVDAFLMSGGTEGGLFGRSSIFTPAERTLVLKGFEAVPVLLKQRHSKRFTNRVMEGFNNFTSYPMNAGQVIDGHLQRFANIDFGSNWLRTQQGYQLDDNAIDEWWEDVSAMGEEAYVKEYVLNKDASGKWQLSNELLLLAQERYPELLPVIQRSVRMKRLLGARGLPRL